MISQIKVTIVPVPDMLGGGEKGEEREYDRQRGQVQEHQAAQEPGYQFLHLRYEKNLSLAQNNCFSCVIVAHLLQVPEILSIFIQCV